MNDLLVNVAAAMRIKRAVRLLISQLDTASTMKSEMRQVIQATTPSLPPISNPERESQNLSLSSKVTKEDEVGRSATYSDQNPKEGKVACGYLGVLIQDVTPAMAKAFKFDQARGALIGDVNDDGPAARAGLARGDIIIELNGEQITGKPALRLRINRTAPKAPVRLKIFRDGAEREIKSPVLLEYLYSQQARRRPPRRGVPLHSRKTATLI